MPSYLYCMTTRRRWKKTRAFLCKFLLFSDFTSYNPRAIELIYISQRVFMWVLLRVRCFLPQNLLQIIFPSLFERKARKKLQQFLN